MKNLGKIVLHIPAREGSKRVPRKNIRLMAGNPMISYVIKAVLMSNVTKNVYINTDSREIMDYVDREYNQIISYNRRKDLASDTATSDQFNMDIINSLKPDTLIMINPVCPLIESTDISNAVLEYQNSDCDTLITCNETQMQTFCNGLPVNIRVDEQLSPSQDNKKVKILNWAITIWDAKKFKKRFDKFGYAVMGENRLLHPIDHLKSFKVSEEVDFQTCQAIISSNIK
jgi:CMP-N,N'-diacetyllegionaminic acid synthase